MASLRIFVETPLVGLCIVWETSSACSKQLCTGNCDSSSAMRSMPERDCPADTHNRCKCLQESWGHS